MPAPLSVVIPTLNAGAVLSRTTDALLSGVTGGLIRDLVISDGGSTDATEAVAKELGAVWVAGPAGRGGQIARGVAAAAGDWLLILHADTELSPDWGEAARARMNTHPDHAGYFRLAFDTAGTAPFLVAFGANLRARVFDLPYGDQGLLIRREVLSRAGGYPEIPLMEDVELARRLKGRLRPLSALAHTSAERYTRDGWARRVIFNLSTLLRYRLGAAPDALAARYRNGVRRAPDADD